MPFESFLRCALPADHRMFEGSYFEDDVYGGCSKIGIYALTRRQVDALDPPSPLDDDQRHDAAFGHRCHRVSVSADRGARFVARARSEAGPDFDAAASSAAATEAFARELRERATPPPPPR